MSENVLSLWVLEAVQWTIGYHVHLTVHSRRVRFRLRPSCVQFAFSYEWNRSDGYEFILCLALSGQKVASIQHVYKPRLGTRPAWGQVSMQEGDANIHPHMRPQHLSAQKHACTHSLAAAATGEFAHMLRMNQLASHLFSCCTPNDAPKHDRLGSNSTLHASRLTFAHRQICTCCF